MDFSEDGRAFMFDINKCRKAFKSGGPEACRRYQKEIEEGWQTMPLNVAVVGQSGVGKSSFINAIRKMTDDDEGAAETEPTTTMKGYEHPDNPLLIFWDLPGVGSELCPKENYMKAIQVDRYDFFILMSATRFYENDDWLASEIHRRGKRFFFVRTKVGVDISNSRRSRPSTHNESKVLERIRKDALDNLQEYGDQTPRVFLIDNDEPEKFNFADLQQSLLGSFSQLQRSAMLLAVRACNEEIERLTTEKQPRKQIPIPKVRPSVGIGVGVGAFVAVVVNYNKAFEVIVKSDLLFLSSVADVFLM